MDGVDVLGGVRATYGDEEGWRVDGDCGRWAERDNLDLRVSYSDLRRHNASTAQRQEIHKGGEMSKLGERWTSFNLITCPTPTALLAQDKTLEYR